MPPRKKAAASETRTHAPSSSGPSPCTSAAENSTHSSARRASHAEPTQQRDSEANTAGPDAAAPPHITDADHSALVRNLRCFYETGRFLSPPRTYADLLRTFLEFFIHCVPCSPPCAASAAEPAAAAPSGGGANGTLVSQAQSRPPPQPAAKIDREQQVRVVSFLAIPHRVAAYFESIVLLTDAECTDEGDGGSANDSRRVDEGGSDTRQKETAVVGPRKRCRSFPDGGGDGGPSASTSTDTNISSLPLNGKRDEVMGGGQGGTAAFDECTAQGMLQRLCDYGATHLRCFDSDSAYLAAKDVLFYVKNYTYSAIGMGLGAALLKSLDTANIDFRRQFVPCVEAVLQLVRTVTAVQLQRMPLAPRVVRLSARLRLSEKAARTFEYLLICHCGRYTPGAVVEPLRPANIAYHNDLTPQELLSILSESGVLWKQGLAFSDIKMRSSFMECKYALPLETIAALSGDQLSEEQLIKLERTALSEVLNEEHQPRRADRPSISPVRGGAGSASRRASRSPIPASRRRRGCGSSAEGKAGDRPGNVDAHFDGEKGSDYEEGEGDAEEEEDDDDGTASVAGSALTITEEALEEALDHIDPAIIATGDADAIQDAVAQHLAEAKATAPTPARSDEEAKAAVAAGEKPASTAESTKEAPVDDSAAAAPAVPARKPQLTLAEINPLAQRHRSGGLASAATAASGSGGGSTGESADSSLRDTPYDSDIEYMDAAFRILANIIRIRYAEGDMKDEEDSFTPKTKVEASLRELKGKVRVAAAVHASRLRATLAANVFTPRIEQLARRLGLTEMEKQIMLFMVGNVISHDMLVAVNGRYVMRDGQRLITVGYVLFVLCETLEERVVARRAFYQSAPLIANGVLSLSVETAGRSCFNTDLMDYLVDIDRKIVDDVMGIVAETAEMVPGSQLYFPAVELENVVLPAATMDRVLSTIEHYSLFEQCKKKSGFGEGLGTSKGGLVMLFFGPSGTGKTMLANAVAHHLRKKILLVSISQFRSSTKAESDALKFLFREAKLNDAIIFFDECESLFEDRQHNATVTALLSEFERYDGLIILATNKAQNFDEAMNRRISLMMEFRPPDHQLRLRIWKSHIPKQLSLAPDVSLEKLALNYELSGGLIRNAVLAALSQAVAREKNASPTLTMVDLDDGAKLQLRGFFLAAQRPEGMSEFYVTPKRTLAELVLEVGLAKKLEDIASTAKSRSTLYTQWGFSEDAQEDCGALYLFQGASGTGKSLAAEGIAYECGATIRLCNVAELLLREEMLVHAVFEEGRRLGAIIVFDEAQVLFNESPKSLQLSQLIHYHARRYPRPVIVIATTTSRDGGGGRQLFSTTSINSRSSCMVFHSELTFALPSRQLREQLWRRAFPERAPVAADVDYAALSVASISPKLIRTVAFNVCCQAALMPAAERAVTMVMIEKEVERARLRERSAVAASAMFA